MIRLYMYVLILTALSFGPAQVYSQSLEKILQKQVTPNSRSCNQHQSGKHDPNMGAACGVMENDPIEMANLNKIPQPGDKAADFFLEQINGKKVRLSNLLKTKPVIMQFGSITCPRYRRQLPGFNKIIDQYQDNYHFVTIYTKEAHPVGSSSPYFDYVSSYLDSINSSEKKRRQHQINNPLEQWAIAVDGTFLTEPNNYQERLSYAQKSSKSLARQNIMLVDSMKNSVWSQWGKLPNNVFIISQDRSILYSQVWVNSEHIKNFLSPEIRQPANHSKNKSE